MESMSLLFKLLKTLLVKCFKLINYIRLFIINSIFFVIVLLFVVALNQQQEPIQVDDNSYLTLELNGVIVEQKKPVNISQQLSKQLNNHELPQEFELQALIETIQYAKEDPKIAGIILQLGQLQAASLDKINDIGNALNEFKAAGKTVDAYAPNYTQSQYLLASYADNIVMAPNGMVILQGFAVNRLYFKELLDKLMITPHVFKVGDYKSFVEPFTETKMSDYSREANQHWLDQLWKNYIETVLKQRSTVKNLNQQSINPSLTELKQKLIAVKGDTADYALKNGLVDELAFYEQFLEKLNKRESIKDIKQQQINLAAYQSTINKDLSTLLSPKKIAVIYANGDIVAGQSDASAIADQSVNKLLKQALDNKQIKAVVIRLQTPGGSAFASENIRQQILALKKADKKVVVSMGSVTASGGYWIASAADKIIASPTTLTGSIGIFGVFATFDKSLEHIGIHHDGVSTNALANLSVTQPLSPQLKEIIQLGIDNGYQDFLNVVSEGRDMPLNDVKQVAQGRVWTGEDALANGLVDEIGNLQTAINSAAKLAEIDNYQVITIKEKLSAKEVFINDLFSVAISYLPAVNAQNNMLTKLFTNLQTELDFAQRFKDPQQRFVYCASCYLDQ